MQNNTKKLLLVVMIAGCFFSTLNQTLLNVAFSDLMDVFSVSPATVQWLATGFMLINGVLVPLTAFLMKRFSTRQLFISSMLFLFIGSLIAAIAPTFAILLTGRMVQAVGAGIIIPLMMTVIVYLYPAEARGAVMGKIGFAIIFAPAIAPTLAGFILEYLSWRWLFIMMLPFTLIIIVCAYKYLMNVQEGAAAKLDIISVLYSTFGFGALLFSFSSVGNRGWGDIVVMVTFVIGIVATTAFVQRQRSATAPMLDFAVYRSRMFTMTTIMNIAVTVIMYADLILLPFFLQNGRGLNALEAGLVLLPGAIINAFLSPVTGKMFDRFGAKFMFTIGFLLIGASMWLVIDVTMETSIVYIILRTIVLRVGLAFISMPLNTAALNALPRELASHGSAMNNTVRQLAGAIGTAVIITLYTSHVATAPTVAEAAAQTYMYLFVLTIVAFCCIFFVPKHTAKQ